ncbi:unnamed protein product [Notodromas monacha]|uniref:Phosphatidic acid phosphatase type 2/haloperoxidase domain-containing protein n=1 Tax=Notodromas monacha TaxID=399045 RepID=A0A7R9BMU1_9CRUS|nr:unnamed protein product [Notodromas monacha]CAG0918078.1 unnamed protein product [Notodromas monacha]
MAGSERDINSLGPICRSASGANALINVDVESGDPRRRRQRFDDESCDVGRVSRLSTNKSDVNLQRRTVSRRGCSTARMITDTETGNAAEEHWLKIWISGKSTKAKRTQTGKEAAQSTKIAGVEIVPVHDSKRERRQRRHVDGGAEYKSAGVTAVVRPDCKSTAVNTSFQKAAGNAGGDSPCGTNKQRAKSEKSRKVSRNASAKVENDQLEEASGWGLPIRLMNQVQGMFECITYPEDFTRCEDLLPSMPYADKVEQMWDACCGRGGTGAVESPGPDSAHSTKMTLVVTRLPVCANMSKTEVDLRSGKFPEDEFQAVIPSDFYVMVYLLFCAIFIVSGRKMIERSVLVRSAVDFCLVAAVGLGVLLFFVAGQPYERGFFCNDVSIRYPYKDSTISNTLLYIIGLVVPTITIVSSEFARAKLPVLRRSVSRQSMRQFFASCYRFMGIFLYGAATSQFFTDVAKYSIGRLRPHFLSICQPDFDCSKTDDPFKYIEDYKCQGKDAFRIRESRLSFLSGHASFSFYTMLFSAIYLQYRWPYRTPKIVRHFVQFLLVVLAYYTSLSRVSDYKHHPTDVFAGAVLGVSVALMATLVVGDKFRPPRDPENPDSEGKVELDANHGL